MRVLELFAGIGGVAAALRDRAEVVGAVDQHPDARRTYAYNFPSHPLRAWNIEGVRDDRLAAFDADLWWMSPPCQPFTIRGHRADVDDPRCRALLRLTPRIASVRPRHLALENVVGFAESRMRRILIEALAGAGYHVRERTLCPTELGVPMRRRRYFLVASRDPVPDWRPLRPHRRRLEAFLDRDPHLELLVPPGPFSGALHVADPIHRPWAGVFTSAYGRSPVHAGSYWRGPHGVRAFAPREILRLLGFPEAYALPPDLPAARAWPLVGNSLSVHAVREVLAALGASRTATAAGPRAQTG